MSQKARDIVEKIRYMTLATASVDGKPWNSPVYTAHDENFNFYWISWRENQHSKNLAENPRAFIVIFDSTVESGREQGVYIDANVEMLEEKEAIEHGASFYYSRKNQEARSAEELMGDAPRRMYKAMPQKIWTNLWDAERKVDDRVEISLL